MADAKEWKRMKGKCLNDYLAEDPSLKQKYSYEEFLSKKTAPDNTDIPIKEAYAEYKEVVSVLEGM